MQKYCPGEIQFKEKNIRESFNMIYNNVLEAMGHTPIIQLNRMNDPEAARVLVKFE